MAKNSVILRWIVSTPVYLYRALISPVLGPCCRYEPSCSEYALTAFKIHGVLKGITLTSLRLLRCHPWSKSGYDPVPHSSSSELLPTEKH